MTAINPKITVAQLRAEAASELSKKTIYRLLKKSDIQNGGDRLRPLLVDTKAAASLNWTLLYNSQPVTYSRRWFWSDECSIKLGKRGTWDFVCRTRGGWRALSSELNYSHNITNEGLLPWIIQGKGTGGQTTMFWEAFGYGKHTELVAMK